MNVQKFIIYWFVTFTVSSLITCIIRADSKYFISIITSSSSISIFIFLSATVDAKNSIVMPLEGIWLPPITLTYNFSTFPCLGYLIWCSPSSSIFFKFFNIWVQLYNCVESSFSLFDYSPQNQLSFDLM